MYVILPKIWSKSSSLIISQQHSVHQMISFQRICPKVQQAFYYTVTFINKDYLIIMYLTIRLISLRCFLHIADFFPGTIQLSFVILHTVISSVHLLHTVLSTHVTGSVCFSLSSVFNVPMITLLRDALWLQQSQG